MKKSNRVLDIIIILIFALLAFVGLSFASRYLMGQYETKDVIITKVEVPAYTEITKDNFSKYFTTCSINKEALTENSIELSEDIIGRFTTAPLREKEIVIADQFSTQKDILSQYENPFEGSFAVTSFSNAASGRIRKGDYVMLYTIDEKTGAQTEATKKPIYISGVFDSSGGEITNDDMISCAVSFNYYINGSEKEEFVDRIFGKKLTVVKEK